MRHRARSRQAKHRRLEGMPGSAMKGDKPSYSSSGNSSGSEWASVPCSDRRHRRPEQQLFEVDSRARRCSTSSGRGTGRLRPGLVRMIRTLHAAFACHVAVRAEPLSGVENAGAPPCRANEPADGQRGMTTGWVPPLLAGHRREVAGWSPVRATSSTQLAPLRYGGRPRFVRRPTGGKPGVVVQSRAALVLERFLARWFAVVVSPSPMQWLSAECGNTEWS